MIQKKHNLTNTLQSLEYQVNNLDLDGVISGTIAHYISPSIKIGGFSNSNDRMYIRAGAKSLNTIQIDINSNNSSVWTIDQHILNISVSDSVKCSRRINPHESFGDAFKRAVNQQYSNKFPYSTAVLMIAMAEGEGVKFPSIDWNATVSNGLTVIDFIMSADSSLGNWANYSYSGNCVNWCNDFLLPLSNSGATTTSMMQALMSINQAEAKNRERRVKEYLSMRYDCYNGKNINVLDDLDIRQIYDFFAKILQMTSPLTEAVYHFNEYVGKREIKTVRSTNDINLSEYDTHAFVFGANRSNNFSGTKFDRKHTDNQLII
ncbi:hypothetical protein [Prevotella histicola]|uniref:hypothetical protein n=1 Tax=Prevotella histicola TaxID=470565 RepID=UPI0028E835FF|nr:hypothetical protein [Prevotella histicola]